MSCSPLPFGEAMLQDESGVYNIRDANGQSTVCAYNAADAAFVRRACNNHESLLAALKSYKIVLAPWVRRPPTVSFAEWESAVERIENALAEAE